MENPEVLWAQSRERLYITIKIVDLKEQNIEILEKNVKFVGSNDKSNFDLNLKLCKDIVPEESKWSVKATCIELSLRKDGDFFWNKLLEEKYNNLRIDWNRWEEDDSDDEVNLNRKAMLDNFSEFTKELPSDLMDKDFTELFNEDLNEEITDDEFIAIKDYGEEYDAAASSDDGFVDNIDLKNIDPAMICKMEEGLITKRDRESLSSPEESLSSLDESLSSSENNSPIPEDEVEIKEDGYLLEDEFKAV
jgi:hypothetical protein